MGDVVASETGKMTRLIGHLAQGWHLTEQDKAWLLHVAKRADKAPAEVGQA